MCSLFHSLHMYLSGVASVSVLNRVLGVRTWVLLSWSRRALFQLVQGVSGKAFCVSRQTGKLNWNQKMCQGG